MPAGGELHFHLLKGGDAKQVVAPEIDDCVKKSAPIVGPSEKLKNKWVGALLLIGTEPLRAFQRALKAAREAFHGLSEGP